ncbi:hypothetical protein [Rhizobium chutanense]|uniref:hypothetical protein n=1 Tax=Rhizobium chutanense TaxID=2035448 RepID=UPI001FDEB9C8|nr:hypothetical protein [Rhizobium chutanense]
MPVLHTLFAGDREFDAARMVPFMRDALGEVNVWHPKFKLITLNMNLGTVNTTDITAMTPQFQIDLAFRYDLGRRAAAGSSCTMATT